jgi:hypothetical protein
MLNWLVQSGDHHKKIGVYVPHFAKQMTAIPYSSGPSNRQHDERADPGERMIDAASSAILTLREGRCLPSRVMWHSSR